MPTFTNNPVNASRLSKTLRKHPSIFGIPFLLIVVGASYGLSTFTQTRYDLQDKKVHQVNKEEELGLRKNKRQFDIREEYFKLSTAQDENWESKRIPRPAGLPEWGVPPTEP
ncbi:cytochrome c oxidase assembly protein COX16-domain-containing protein, partial [Abortiporus biennis]